MRALLESIYFEFYNDRTLSSILRMKKLCALQLERKEAFQGQEEFQLIITSTF